MEAVPSEWPARQQPRYVVVLGHSECPNLRSAIDHFL